MDETLDWLVKHGLAELFEVDGEERFRATAKGIAWLKAQREKSKLRQTKLVGGT